MNYIQTLKKIFRGYPVISGYGHRILKNIWSIQAEIKDYKYPTDNSATISYNLVKEFNKNRIFGPKTRVCYAAFNNMHFQMNGDVTSCSFNYDVCLGNILNNSIKEIWFGEKAEKFRENMANYNLDNCLSCKKVLLSKNFISFPALKYDSHSSDELLYPTQMSFETSDLCNYACIMCNENFSSAIKKEKGLPHLKKVYPENFTEQLQEFIPHLKTATFIGGEPLLIKEYYDIWDTILQKNPTCKIHIQSNGSILLPKFLKLLESGQFNIGISLDSVNKKTFEKIRLNSDYDEVYKNILQLKSFEKSGKITMNINYCPLTLNWHELPEVIEFSDNHDISLKIVHVTHPFHLGLSHRSPEYLNNIFTTLTATRFNKNNTLISKLNKEVFDGFLKNIQFYIGEAEKRDAVITEYRKCNLENLFENLLETLRHNKKFIHFNSNEKEQLFMLIKEKLHVFERNKQIFILCRMLFYFNEADVEGNSDMATNFNTGIKTLENIILQLELLSSETTI